MAEEWARVWDFRARTPALRAAITHLGGYETTQSGQIVALDMLPPNEADDSQ